MFKKNINKFNEYLELETKHHTKDNNIINTNLHAKFAKNLGLLE